MIYFQIQDTTGKILSGNMQDIPDESLLENNSKSQNNHKKNFKSFYDEKDGLKVQMIVKDEKNLLSSSKLFRKTFLLYQTVGIDVYKQYKKEIQAYAHTLNTIQAQMGQKIDDFADQDKFHGETYRESLDKILAVIENDKKSTADLICYMQKRVVDMKAQLLGSEVIHSGEQYEIKPTEVSLKRAILNQVTPFLDDFFNKSVALKFFFDDQCKIIVDKNMFSLIMYNFFSNASKYSKKNSEVHLNYSPEDKSLDISMISLKMEKKELKSLHEEGRRGIHAKKYPGRGIGLFVISRALYIMGKQPMYMSPKYEKSTNENGQFFIENHFKFSL